MIKMTFAEAANACGGTLTGSDLVGAEHVRDEFISGITIDSRKVVPGALFIAFKGERVDGHDFISTAMEKGAHCVISERDVPFCHIRVENSVNAMQALASYIRKKSGIPVIAVVGSVGKTSTRQLIACTLAKKYKVLSTSGNFNNEYGLPQMLFRLEPQHEIAVLELGISHFGEMDRLGAIATPDIAVYTNIGHMHLENLHDREGVFKAKTELIAHMNPNAHLLLNGDDEILRKHSYPISATYFGMDETYPIYPSDIVQNGIESTSFVLHIRDKSINVTLPAIGMHMVQNAIAAANIADMLKLSIDEIADGLSDYVPVGSRGKIIDAGYFTIIDDCYNAGPDSMRASLNALPDGNGRCIALLGDMLEIGDSSKLRHYELGKFCAEAKLDMLFVFGEDATHIAEGASDGGMEQVYNLNYLSDNKDFNYLAYDKISQFILEKLQRDDVLLIKASRGMKFEKIIESILEENK